MSDKNIIPVGLCQCGCGQRTSLAKKSSTKNGLVKGQPMKFIAWHEFISTSAQKRSRLFWLRVDKNGPTPQSQKFPEQPMSTGWEYDEENDIFNWIAGPCWLWEGAKNSTGYGEFSAGRGILAHRFAFCDFYKIDIKAIKGLDLIHGCDTPACVNPRHVGPANAEQNNWDKVTKGRAKHSEEAKRKIGAANAIALLGRKATEEAKRNQSEGLKRAYAEGRRNNRKPSPLRRFDVDSQQLATLYNQGIGSKTLSERFKLDPSTVLRRLVKAGVKIRLPGTNQSKLRQAGFVLLIEMCIVCLCMLTLAAIAIPNAVQMAQASSDRAARDRLLLVGRAAAEFALCQAAAPACVQNPGVVAVIPTDGVSFRQQGYNFLFVEDGVSPGGWHMTGLSVSPGRNFWIDGSLILRCTVGGAIPNSGSPVC